MATDPQAATALLIRTHYVDEAVGLMADRFQRESGLPVWLVLDQSAGPIEGGDLGIVQIDGDLCADSAVCGARFQRGWRVI